jgi:hypothetical protein
VAAFASDVGATWLRDWNHAFRAAASTPLPEGRDPTALALFGRD